MGPSREAGSVLQRLMGVLNAEGHGQKAESAIIQSVQPMVSGISGVIGVDVPSPVMVAGKGG